MQYRKDRLGAEGQSQVSVSLAMRNKRPRLIGGTDWHEADSRKMQTYQDDVKFWA
jgi:hypothetical protein